MNIQTPISNILYILESQQKNDIRNHINTGEFPQNDPFHFHADGHIGFHYSLNTFGLALGLLLSL